MDQIAGIDHKLAIQTDKGTGTIYSYLKESKAMWLREWPGSRRLVWTTTIDENSFSFAYWTICNKLEKQWKF